MVLLDSLEKRCHLSSTANITVLTRQAGASVEDFLRMSRPFGNSVLCTYAVLGLGKERFSPCASESVVTPDGSYTVNFTPACLPGPVDIRCVSKRFTVSYGCTLYSLCIQSTVLVVSLPLSV